VANYVFNPYTGKTEETCSVSFTAQQQMAGGVSSPQTEAEYHQSKLLGEIGVMKGKYANGEIPDGVKLFTFENEGLGVRGYFISKGGQLKKVVYSKDGGRTETHGYFNGMMLMVKTPSYKTAIPQAVSPKPKAEPVKVYFGEPGFTENTEYTHDETIALSQSGDEYIKWNGQAKKFETWHTGEQESGPFQVDSGDTLKSQMYNLPWHKPEVTPAKPASPEKKKEVVASDVKKGDVILGEDGVWYPVDQVFDSKAQGKYLFYNQTEDKFILKAKPNEHVTVKTKDATQGSPEKVTVATETPPASSSQVAAPTPASPVNPGSSSVGSMSNEDVAAMFVKIKDDLAKEKGLNIKGANPALDQEVYSAIGKVIGYTPAEVKGKIGAYKAEGNKLSALKKKVQAGTKKVPPTSPQPTKASPAAPLNTGHTTNTPAQDPKPNGVPTVATPSAANQAKEQVKETVEAEPAKVYSDEDVAAAYIIAKDKVVAESNGKWTLYSKSDEMDLEIAIQVGLKIGLNPMQQKQAIANYLATGKKLSALKKSLAKQGVFKPQADTLKKTKAEQTEEEKQKEAEHKADEGYTPTPTPATGTPPTDTGKPAPNSVKKEAEQSGDISGISQADKTALYNLFKGTASQSYLDAAVHLNYQGFLKVQAQANTGTDNNWSLLQIIRVIDEEGAKKFGVDNTHVFEKKVVTWLSSPEGTKYLKDQEAVLAKQAEEAKKKAEAEKLAKELEDKQPPLPADSAQYQPWELEKAKRVSQTWLDAQPWDDRQKRDLKHYTGNAYTEMNKYLRGLSTHISDRSKSAIEGARKGMRPTTEPIMVRRGSGADQFKSLGVARGDLSLLWGITGKTFKDEGFLSTSAGGRAAFGGEVRLEIECPIGTPMAYVAPISNFPNENEMLLQAGLEYKVLNVRKEGNQFIVRMRVVNWPGKDN